MDYTQVRRRLHILDCLLEPTPIALSNLQLLSNVMILLVPMILLSSSSAAFVERTLYLQLELRIHIIHMPLLISLSAIMDRRISPRIARGINLLGVPPL